VRSLKNHPFQVSTAMKERNPEEYPDLVYTGLIMTNAIA